MQVKVNSMKDLKQVLQELKRRGNPANVEGMARFGMTPDQRLGVSVPEMRKIARQVGKNHSLALTLWKTGIPEARIVAGMVADPHKLTEAEMDDWVTDFNSWDVCDQVCMNLFDKSPLAWKKVRDWANREEEFVKRAAFALLACLAWHDKNAEDSSFTGYFSIIREASTDERNFVKKAVNWALRHIGKRNRRLNQAAIQLAREIQDIDSKAARWIARDAIRELESEAAQNRLKS